MYLRGGLSYYERGMSAYPGPRARLRGLGVPMLTTHQVAALSGIGQDDDTDISDISLPLTPPSVEPLSTAPMPVAPMAPLPGSTSYAPPGAAPTITPSLMPLSTITQLSTAQPSVLSATYAGMSLTTWILLGFGLVAAAAAFGSGARR
jgi:hypothetical protein